MQTNMKAFPFDCGVMHHKVTQTTGNFLFIDFVKSRNGTLCFWKSSKVGCLCCPQPQICTLCREQQVTSEQAPPHSQVRS